MSYSNKNKNKKMPALQGRLSKVLLSYPNLFTPRTTLNGDLQYGVAALLDKRTHADQIKRIDQELWTLARQAWPDGEAERLRKANVLWWPLRDGDGFPQRKGYRGRMFISMKAKERPGVVDANVNPIMDQSLVYPGVSANVTYSMFAYDQPQLGLSVWVNNVQILGGGERLGGRSAAEDDFEPVALDPAAPSESTGATWLS